MTAAEPAAGQVHLARWTCSTGSNMQSRAAVILESGEHRWHGTAEGSGAIGALLSAVDDALQEVLAGHPRIVAYEVHAVAEGADAEGRVTVRIAPPAQAPADRARGEYEASRQSPNVVAASVEAYLDAVNQLLAEAAWSGATEAAGNRRRMRHARHGAQPKAEFDEASARHDTSAWFER